MKCPAACMLTGMLFHCLLLTGQNLVPNPSFEDIQACPVSISAIPYAPAYNYFPYLSSWVSPSQDGTPDYFHTCAPAQTAASVHVPENYFGFRTPYRGNAYAGFYPLVFEDTNQSRRYTEDYREYLSNRLSSPLLPGREYYVSFFVSRASLPGLRTRPSPDKNIVLVDRIGAYFSSRSINAPSVSKAGGNPPPHYDLNLRHTPQIANIPGNFIEDTASWIKIQGILTASGGEQWMTIGYFHDGGPLSYLPHITLSPSATRAVIAYLYIDEVCVLDMTASLQTRAHRISKCPATATTLHAAAGGTLHAWNTGDSTAQINADTPGTYWVKTWGDCSYSIDTFVVTDTTPPAPELGADTRYCHGTSITLTPGPGYAAYLWSTGSSAPSITVTESGIYSVTVTDSCGTRSDSVRIDIAPYLPPPAIPDILLCLGDPAPLRYEGEAGLTWFTDTTGAESGTEQLPEIQTDRAGSLTLFAAAVSDNCMSTAAPVRIVVLQAPEPVFSGSERICDGESLSLESTPQPHASYLWNTGDTGCCIITHKPGDYILTITNPCGSSESHKSLTAYPCERCLWMPDAFTPNGDGRNDRYTAQTRCPLRYFTMIITDRWGNTLFRSASPGQSWDGTAGGAPAEPGTYFYLVEAVPDLPRTAPVLLKGDLTLIR